MDSVEFWRKFYREQYDKTWDKNPEQANAYLGIAIALGDTLRDMKQIAEGWNIPSSFFFSRKIHIPLWTNKLQRRCQTMKNVKNKVYAIALMGLSFVTMMLDKDATLFIIISFISVPMFFAKENWVN